MKPYIDFRSLISMYDVCGGGGGGGSIQFRNEYKIAAFELQIYAQAFHSKWSFSFVNIEFAH